MTIPISSTIRTLAACWTGTSYVVSWQQDEGESVYVAGISRDGNPESAPQRIAHGARASSHNVATNGRRVLLTYGLLGSSSLAVRAAVLDSDAHLIATDLPVVGTAASLDDLPVVASDGKDFALVWRTGSQTPIVPTVASSPPPLVPQFNNFHLLRLDESGTPIGKEIGVGQTDLTQDFGVAYGGGRYAIAAIAHPGIQAGQSHTVRFIVDPATGNTTLLPQIDTAGFTASVFWNGSRFVAYWMNYDFNFYKLMTVPFSGQLEATPPQPFIAVSASHLGYEPRIAFNGKNVFVAWTEDTNDTHGGNAEIIGRLFDPEARTSEGDRVLVSTAWSRQYWPSIATSGSDSLVVWVDERGSEQASGILAARIASDGTVVDRSPLVLASSVAAAAPLVTFNGTSYLAVWQEASYEVVARTVARDGTVGPRVVVGSGWGVGLASNQSESLVVLTSGSGVVAFRLDARGQPIDTAPLAIGSGDMPKVATNGTDFLVAWDTGSDWWQFPSPNMVDVLGARVSAAGSVDASPIGVANGAGDEILAAIASDGRDYLVVYTYRDVNHETPVLAAKRVLREGELDGATSTDIGTIVATGVNAGSVGIAHGDTGFWMSWLSVFPGSLLQLTRTDARGKPADAITLAPGDTVTGPSLAQAPGRLLEIAYARRITDGPFAGTSRVLLRVAGDLASHDRAVRH
ncbi:MAG TPA: hypothetical protein VF980_01600 [Thermoanaerobaculia bacterium]